MRVNRPPDWHETVRAHWEETTGFLLARSEPCITIRDEELEAIKGNRVLVGVSIKELEGWDFPASWILGVLLCPDDSTERLVEWVDEASIDTTRVHFYLHTDASWDVLQAWHDAGYPTDRVDDDIDSWQRLHRLFGLALNDRVVKDWRSKTS